MEATLALDREVEVAMIADKAEGTGPIIAQTLVKDVEAILALVRELDLIIIPPKAEGTGLETVTVLVRVIGQNLEEVVVNGQITMPTLVLHGVGEEVAEEEALMIMSQQSSDQIYITTSQWSKIHGSS